MSPEEAITAFKTLGCRPVPRHSRKNYVWLELDDEGGRQIAIFNVPTSKNPIRKGTLLNGLLRPNGIRDENHLRELLNDPDPPAAFWRALPKGGPRYRPGGQ
ncbi:MAG: hypothetical protein JF888_08875 [Candidatus Dormibacteraeota bacterium]|uniref:Uncharacterized protein n=1 Tax=Candidatus Dormiibacter inghamiae TaxID=3127013 RepID=A0A934KD68_9BACT|nr:hypothetical protein [Candidatus Dormibacteraeota bacterium]MBJ7606486.1 hypothetical protein [Candidatus Dormibacteraeota bacterium]